VAVAKHRGGTIAYIADEDSRALHVIALDRGVQVGKTQLDGAPVQVLVLDDGRVAVSLKNRGRVRILEPRDDLTTPLATLCDVSVPDEPWGLAATRDDRSLLVTAAWGARLDVVDTATMSVTRSVPLIREPRAIVVDDDGRRAFVSHAVGSRVSVVELQSGAREPRHVSLGVKAMTQRTPLVDGDRTRTGSQAFALAKAVTDDGSDAVGEKPKVSGKAPKPSLPAGVQGRIYVPMATVDPGNEFERSTQYYGMARLGTAVHEPIVSVVDEASERSMTRRLITIRPPQSECILPRAAVVNGKMGTLLVACAGIDAVVELDARGADPMRMELRRWGVAGGPTGMAIDAARERAVVWSQFDGKLTVLDLSAKARAPEMLPIAYAPAPEVEALRMGRDLFHRTADRRLSSNGLACASCHPEGRDDGLTWATIDGPRQTLMLAGRMNKSGPYGWMGQHEDLPKYVGNTISRLGGNGLLPVELGALVSYVENVAPPDASDGAPPSDRNEAIARGRDLFFDSAQGCATCHLAGNGSDGKQHDVGSQAKADSAQRFDTPSLKFVSGTAPYFHDGRYQTLGELLAAPDSRMGHSAHLNEADRAALAAFLETL
jgi:DNA-binding beta-propeller fold protein YncE